MSESLHRKIEQLTDEKAEGCLNVLLKSLTIESSDYGELLQSREDMKEVLEQAAQEVKITGLSIDEIDSPQERVKTIRFILHSLADDQRYSSQVEAVIDNFRPSLIEPVTTAIILASVIFVLSSDIDFKYENKNGQRNVSFNFRKKPTSDSLLGKFFGLFK